MNINRIIRQRTSVRTFNPGHKVEDELERILFKSISEAYTPFGGNFIIELKRFPDKKELRPGTYGVISGAEMYLLLYVKDNDPIAELSAGFAMEQVILKATELGLGTCWIAATLKKTDFEIDNSIPEDYSLRIVSPVGYKADHKRFLERTVRAIAGSSSRKPMDKLFFKDNPSTPLPEDNIFYNHLASMRLAPSSRNSQPWRAIVNDNSLSFYPATDNRCTNFDMGIGLSHFYLSLKSSGMDGTFSLKENRTIKFTLNECFTY